MKKILSVLLCVSVLAGFTTLYSKGVYDGEIDWDAEAVEVSSYNVGDIIEYGTYPQTDVTDSMGDVLNKQGGSWKSYGYYSGTGDWDDGQMKSSDYMKYKDVTYNGSKYRGVTFGTYRPIYTGYKSTNSTNSSYQDDNGFTIGNVYWFRFEPLRWRVLDTTTGLIVCDTIIDSQPYTNYIIKNNDDGEYYNDKGAFTSDWKTSSLNSWLNSTFYSTAFSLEQKNNIESSFHSNKGYLTGQAGFEKYDGVDTNEKIYLLSYEEAKNSEYFSDDKSRQAKGTDYAKCQGLWVYNDSASSFYGCSHWLLRTPYSHSFRVADVNRSGGFLTVEMKTYYVYMGIRPAMCLKELKSDSSGSEITESSSESDGMRVIANNTSLSYYINDYIVFAVSSFKNNVESKINHIEVKNSNDSILKLENIFSYDSLPSYLQFDILSELKNCQFVVFKAISSGAVGVTITDTSSREYKFIPLIITEDEYACLRANEVKTILFNGNENVTFNAYFKDVVISSFDYEKISNGFNFSMNIYNHNACPGVVEVFDSNGQLSDVRTFDKYELMTTSLWKTYKTGWIVVGDAVTGKIFDFRSELYTKKTTISDLFVPNDGYIRVTCDTSISSICALDSFVDMVFSALSMAENVSDFISGANSLSKNDVKNIVKTINAKLLLQKEKKEFSEEFQKKFFKSFGKKLTIGEINRFSSEDISQFARESLTILKDIYAEYGLNINDVIKTALKASVKVAEDVFLNSSSQGKAIKLVFTVVDIENFRLQVKHTLECQTGKAAFICYTPTTKTAGILTNDNVVVNTYGKVPDNTVLESYHIINGDANKEQIIDNKTGKIIKEYQQYEVALLNKNEFVQPSGKVTVSLACPYKKATVARQNADGKWEILDAHLENGIITFEVDHFCKFAVSDDEDNSYYAISYDANGGIGAPAKQISTDNNFTLSSEIPKRDGYVFLGWDERSYTTTPNLKPGAGIMLIAKEIKLYAIWEKMPLANAVINVKPSANVSIGNNVKITATAKNVPEGYNLVICEGKNTLAEGDNKSVTYTVEQIMDDMTLNVYVVKGTTIQENSDGLLEKTVEIKVGKSFFERIIAFFRTIFFIHHPTVEVKPE